MTRFVRCSPVDEAAVVDINSHDLAPGYRAAVTSALPVGIEPPAEFWIKLANIIVDYFVLAEMRATQPDLDRMERIIGLIDKLNAEIRATDRPALSQWAQVSGHVLSTLGPAKVYAETYVAGYSRVTAHFAGRNSPYRQMLYDRVLDLWRYYQFGQDSDFSRTLEGVPSGPLVKFFIAVTVPVLGGKAPNAHGVGKIIKRAAPYLSTI